MPLNPTSGPPETGSAAQPSSASTEASDAAVAPVISVRRAGLAISSAMLGWREAFGVPAYGSKNRLTISPAKKGSATACRCA